MSAPVDGVPPTATREPARWQAAARMALVAAATAVVVVVLVGVPTDLIDTPLFSREIPPTWWAWPSLAASAALSGLLAATYVGPSAGVAATDDPANGRRGLAAGVLTYLAVGCPVCNKLALVALGASGAVTWFAPFQPLLQVVALALLTWAVVLRLRTRGRCPLPTAAPQEESP